MSLFDDAKIIITPNAVKAGKLYGLKGTHLDVVRATTATRVNSSGLIENVSANVPRIDYSNGSCPSILVEPQRTNLVLRSEEFDNDYWNKTNATISANSIISPDGIPSADTIIANNLFAQHRIEITISGVVGTIYTLSGFFKAKEFDKIGLRTGNNGYGLFDLTTGTIIFTDLGVTANIVNYGNGWYRCSVSQILTTSSTMTSRINILDENGLITFAGDNLKGIYIWGAQLEAGANATSYIPTTTASVTRNADVISKTGISSLIGQTEGTVLCDINLTKLSEGKTLFVIDNGTTNEYIVLTRVSSNIFRLTIKNSSGAAVNIINSIVINDARCKVGIAYKNGDYAMYVNGVLRGTSTNSTNYPTTALTQFILSNASYGQLNDSYNVSALWKTRLSNSELAILTTI